MNLFTQGRITLATCSLIAALALTLITSLHAQTRPLPRIGTFYSAKDPDLPPLPFNPHPELSVTEVDPGHYVVDDTGIPDTPEKAAAREARQAAREQAQAIASNPIAAQAAQAAQQAAQEATWEKNRQEIAQWLVSPLPATTGAPSNRESLEAGTQSELIELASHFNAAQQALLQTATNTGTPTEVIFPNGERAVLAGFESGQPVWNMNDGITQAVSIGTASVWPGGGAGFGLTGTNTPVGQWEAAGIPRLTHAEFQGRVSVRDGTTNSDSHATGVASVLNGAGLYDVIYPVGVTNYQAAKGMSYAAPVLSHDSVNDMSEMASEAATNAFRISNHSYSIQCGWRWVGVWVWYGDTNVSQSVDWKFGAYNTNAYSIDTNVYAARTYLPVWTPGNSRDEGPPVQPTNHYILGPGCEQGCLVTNVMRSIDGDAGGYDTIHPNGCAKNVLTVGAVSNLVNGYSGTGSVQVGTFSPYGPTDDGRIKPDIVAPGVDIIMADSAYDTAFQRSSGTSFAAPAIAGSINLLNQLRTSFHTNSRAWLASSMKGLVIHTADEADGTGPDYRFGWGLMNTRRAAELIRNNATNGWKSFIKEVFLPDGGSIEFPVLALDGTNPLKLTICWTDPAGPAQTNAAIDPVVPRLVNDLDLRVISPSGVTNFPWILNPDLTNQSPTARAAPATTGDDTRNNVEQVIITNAVASNYLLRVTHKGTLGTSGQWVSLLLSGVQAQSKPPLFISQPSVTASDNLAFAWPSVVGQLYQVQYLNNLEGATWSNWDGEISATKTNTAVQVDMTGPAGRRFYRVMEVE